MRLNPLPPRSFSPLPPGRPRTSPLRWLVLGPWSLSPPTSFNWVILLRLRSPPSPLLNPTTPLLGHTSIVWKLWTADSSDMIWDFILTLISVTLTYAGPFFLQRFLAAIDSLTPGNRAKAYIYAFATFLTMLLKVSHRNGNPQLLLTVIS